MANPQKENGYTPVANEILERMSSVDVSGGAMRVLMVIIRKTYGFHKKKDAIALSQFVKATNYGKRNVIYILQELEAKGIIRVERQERDGAKLPSEYSLNKDYDTWVVQNTAPQVKKNRRRAKLRQRKLRHGGEKGVDSAGRTKRGGAKHHQKVVQNYARGGAKVLHIQKKLIQKKDTKGEQGGLKPQRTERREGAMRSIGEIIKRNEQVA